MWIKIIIVVLMLGILVSLVSSFVFLMKDKGNESKRTVHSLGVRVTLAGLLLVVITYGLLSGELKFGAPWSVNNGSSPATVPQTNSDSASSAKAP